MLSRGLIGSFTPSWATHPPLTRQDGFDPDRPMATEREAETLAALVDPDCPGKKEGAGWARVCPAGERGPGDAGDGDVPCPTPLNIPYRATRQVSSPAPAPSARVSTVSPRIDQEASAASARPPRVPACAPGACAAAQQRGCLARGWLVWAARGGTGARGHQKALRPLLAAAPTQPLRALRPPGAAQFA